MSLKTDEWVNVLTSEFRGYRKHKYYKAFCSEEAGSVPDTQGILFRLMNGSTLIQLRMHEQEITETAASRDPGIVQMFS